MTLPTPARAYLLAALDNTPATLAALLCALGPSDPAWDARPHPDRFSLREVVAHLADWDLIWQDRFARTVAEASPTLARPDAAERGAERGYASADPVESLARFRERRAALTATLRALPEAAWERTAHLERIGDLPLGGLVALALGHDAYHLRQAAEWLAAGSRDAQGRA
jgi:uncharacterized damage-inducible protein DinB